MKERREAMVTERRKKILASKHRQAEIVRLVREKNFALALKRPHRDVEAEDDSASSSALKRPRQDVEAEDDSASSSSSDKRKRIKTNGEFSMPPEAAAVAAVVHPAAMNAASAYGYHPSPEMTQQQVTAAGPSNFQNSMAYPPHVYQQPQQVNPQPAQPMPPIWTQGGVPVNPQTMQPMYIPPTAYGPHGGSAYGYHGYHPSPEMTPPQVTAAGYSNFQNSMAYPPYTYQQPQQHPQQQPQQYPQQQQQPQPQQQQQSQQQSQQVNPQPIPPILTQGVVPVNPQTMQPMYIPPTAYDPHGVIPPPSKHENKK